LAILPPLRSLDGSILGAIPAGAKSVGVRLDKISKIGYYSQSFDFSLFRQTSIVEKVPCNMGVRLVLLSVLFLVVFFSA
jgi:hypothetical protein